METKSMGELRRRGLLANEERRRTLLRCPACFRVAGVPLPAFQVHAPALPANLHRRPAACRVAAGDRQACMKAAKLRRSLLG